MNSQNIYNLPQQPNPHYYINRNKKKKTFRVCFVQLSPKQINISIILIYFLQQINIP